ncbi:MAG: LysR family transcriptional regulator [Caloramator sp.]|jgi:DNA-binding transcriptional LysR family regulator|uniref:selenium metabolism-associated LysR family transcriptional regulator n=1 Tax=Caloramator sp. TaxID=1871330 RepID=UPI001DD87E65|nr:selenium metabolism-associated LysR family transcriptional regulator [Caloramator sp.]MBZ4662560.1 LysR family transcriptional regulator [Caloramator sp.]
MDFKQIEAFINVAKYKSFSKAAEATFLSQPTISSHISSLEKELKVMLFDRNGKDIRLTEAGKLFYEYAINLVNIRDNAISSLLLYDNKICGKITIAASTTPCRFLLPEAIKSFSKLYNEVSYDIKEGSTQYVVDQLISFNIDLGIVGDMIDDCKLTYTNIFQDKLVLISNFDNLDEKVDFKDIIELPFIQREDGSATRRIFEKKLYEIGFNVEDLNTIINANSLETVIQLVKNKIGVSIVSYYACKDLIESKLLKFHTINDLDIVRPIYLVYHNKKTLSPASRAFIEHIKNLEFIT